MMPFFPTPYPDELLYSILARYHLRSGNISFKATMEDAFGTKNATAVVELPSNLNALISNLPLNNEYTADYLVDKHTLFPFYTAFLSPKRSQWVRNNMMKRNGKGIYGKTGIMASSIVANKYFKFCTLCNEEDKEQYGELYWHRIHQIPGVLVCPKHQVVLCDSKVPIKGYNKHQYVAASERNCIKQDSVFAYSDKTMLHLIELAKDVEFLLNNQFERRTTEWFHEQYKAKLIEQGFATINGNVMQKKLAEEFIQFYGEEFLSLVQSSIEIGSENNWLADMVRGRNKASHPIRHLLLSRFLGITISDLFYKQLTFKPFGDGPWPCLNPVAEHYLKPVVKQLKISYSNDTKRPVGTFSCDCGFVYVRTGPDVTEESRYKVGKIKKFGHVWEAKLKELVEKGLSLRQTAKLMGADPKTVKKYAAKLGLETYWEKRSNRELFKDKGNSVTTADKRDYYRGEWFKLMNHYPDKSKTELRQLNKAVYAWLYRNDKEWLKFNSPEPIYTYKNTRVDWDKRDKEILDKVKVVVEEILNSTKKPERVTISLVGSKLGIRGLLEKHLDKMPLTKQYLDSVKESRRDFQLRRIKWAVQKLENEGQEPKMWKVLREAGIRKEFCQELEDDIIEIIKK
jgi:hypothetical protein